MSANNGSNPLSRRQALAQMGTGFGLTALASMVSQSVASAETTTQPKKGHYPGKAEHVLFLFMNGGCSSIDSFDYKPTLEKYHGQPLPSGSVKTERKTGSLMKSPFAFKQYGNSGHWFSELWPHLGGVADEIAMVKSMWTDIPNHEPSLLMMNTGHNQPGRPSLGAWLTYGLGTENQNLPGFMVLCPDQPTVVGPPLWSNGFLPSIYQGTYVSDKVEKEFDPYKLLPYIQNKSFTLKDQRRELDLLSKLNKHHLDRMPQKDPMLESSIQSMETAFRMQTEAPEVFDIRKESKATQEMYGPGSTARGCLTAVRLIEKGVRMVQVYYAKADPWDAHDDIFKHRKNARDSDQPFAAAIKDLKARGLLEKTLVVCGSEFGRTPVMETGGGGAEGRVVNGRDHNPFGFTVWLAGAGIKKGTTVGATDDFGFKAIEKPYHIHDLHATILHLMGIEHTKLTYNYSGRDFRLTDVHGNIIKELLA
jgi:hypothetical protein